MFQCLAQSLTGPRGGVILPAFLLSTLTGCSGPFSTLDPAGPSATAVAGLWWAMCVFFSAVLVMVSALWVYAIKRRDGGETQQQAQRLQNRWIFWGGFVLPLSSIVVLLTFGIPIGHSMLPLPPEEGEALRIDVQGHQWWWQVRYPGSAIELRDELHIPINTPVDIHLRSEDVIHSFWVPRLGGKMDVFPGRTNVLRLQAQQSGVYRGQCAEFCGRGHAHMQFKVIVHDTADFDTWLRTASDD